MSVSQEDFTNTIKEYMKLDQQIAEYEKSLKVLKDRKTVLFSKIHVHMQQNEIKQINLPKGEKLQTYSRKTREGLNKNWIQNRLKEYCTVRRLNPEELIDFIYNPAHRKQVEKNSLKKVAVKKKN
jgi:hypothetical protein